MRNPGTSLLLAAGLIIAMTGASRAENREPAAPKPTASTDRGETRYDEMLASRDWAGLSNVLPKPASYVNFIRSMNWLKTNIDDGQGGLALTTRYAADLWTLGMSMQATNDAKNIIGSAALMELYSFELVVIDGAACQDVSAPAGRLQQLLKNGEPIFAAIREQSADYKTHVIDAAIGLEQKTAPNRKPDEFICQDGLDEMKSAMETGKVNKGISTPDSPTKTVDLKAPDKYKSKFIEKNAAMTKAADLRPNLKSMIFDLLK